jgi:hypothetical protein
MREWRKPRALLLTARPLLARTGTGTFDWFHGYEEDPDKDSAEGAFVQER